MRATPATATSGLSAASPPAAQRELIAIAAGIWKARALYAAARLGLADLIGNNGSTVQELAQKTGTHAPSLKRLLRTLGGVGVVTENGASEYRLTELGAALRQGEPASACAAILTLAGDWQLKAWRHVLYSLRTGEPAMREAFGQDLFEFLGSNLEAAEHFNRAMVDIHGGDGADVVAAYDFSGLRTIVDVGGGTGVLLTTILRSNPHLRGVLYELTQTLPQAQALIAEHGLVSRCDVVAGDFFRGIPAGHEAYILSHVLHDWPDAEALTILRNCRRAITPAGRLLILEAVVPAGDAPHVSKMMDLLMLTVTGGLERTTQEYSALLAEANFQITKLIPLTSDQSILEAAPR